MVKTLRQDKGEEFTFIDSGKLYLINIMSGLIRSIDIEEKYVSAYSLSDKTLVVGNQEGLIRVFEVESGTANQVGDDF